MTTVTTSTVPQPGFDGRAAVIAALTGGAIFLVIAAAVTGASLQDPYIVLRLTGSIVLGSSVVVPNAPLTGTVFAVGLVIHLLLSLVFGVFVAFLIHRWGLLVGIIGGGLLGLALYAINFYTLSYFFPWFYAFRSYLMVTLHFIFGALAGGIYELLDQD